MTNPFLVTFLACLMAQVIWAVVFSHYINYRARKAAEAAISDPVVERIQEGSRAASRALFNAEDSRAEVSDPDGVLELQRRRTRVRHEICVEILNGRMVLESLPGCPMCDRSFRMTHRFVHLCKVHGRGCEGCEDVLEQFERFTQAQGEDQLTPDEVRELARLRGIVRGSAAATSSGNSIGA